MTTEELKYYSDERIKCPYCGQEIEIDHEDGYGYEEEEIHTQECDHCGKTFKYYTYVHFSYEVGKCDCHNGKPHIWEPTATYPKKYTKMECQICGMRRNLTQEEIEKYKLNDD